MLDFELRQRQTLGVLIILLPALTVLFGLLGIGTNPQGWFNSISDTYYSNSNALMVGIIAIAAFFFCTYKGYDWKDRAVNILSGVGLIGLLIFPCANIGKLNELVGLFNLPAYVSGKIHNVCAILSFSGFFLNLEFIFTLHEDVITPKKKIRNLIYRVCGLSIAPVAIILLAFTAFGKLPKYWVLISETIALVPCGFAWLVKGKTFKKLNDD